MTLDDRQYMMTKAQCGVTRQWIAAMMQMSDEKIIKGLEMGRAAILKLEGPSLAKVKGAVRATEIEAEIRGIAL